MWLKVEQRGVYDKQVYFGDNIAPRGNWTQRLKFPSGREIVVRATNVITKDQLYGQGGGAVTTEVVYVFLPVEGVEIKTRMDRIAGVLAWSEPDSIEPVAEPAETIGTSCSMDDPKTVARMLAESMDRQMRAVLDAV